ncbi:PREDICTED: bZIP transcription factor 11-like [Camelina sativa]|uniref:BZIP transcription factor 11-like n=1 Tax=Camelina sativa TaxID=90675 RepID=A0ABM0YNJ2_CAMSA|nr:PREDICTED: bZIP transcription factor 11-like [Camelina sativa]
MMSTISPVFSAEPSLATFVPAFETGFTPWDISHLFSVFDSSLDPIQSPAHDFASVNRTSSDVAPTEENTHERKKKRKLSNRESAKRSREKKQKHLEEMSIQLNQLKTQNHELTNQLRYVSYHCQRTNTENERLRLENRILQDKLLNIRQVLMFRQIERSLNCSTWPCDNSTVVTVQQDPSMIY